MLLQTAFFSILAVALAAPGGREKKIAETYEAVQRIEEHLKKEDRLKEIADSVRIDATLDRLSEKIDTVIELLGISGELSARLQASNERMSRFESKVEQHIGEMDRRTTQLKEDLSNKLRKISNIVTALYEMNKEVKATLDSDTSAGVPSSSSYAADFLAENLDELERKMKEHFSVLSSEMRSEIGSLRVIASARDCRNEEDTLEWTPAENFARSVRSQTVERSLDELGRATREIRQEIQQGIQDIDAKLSNMTSRCVEPLQESDSVAAYHRVRPQYVEGQKPCTKDVKNVASPKSCADLRKGGATCDGIYVVFPQGVRAVRVLCDMTTDGGGWTVIMRRGEFGDKMTTFHKNWASYKNGFGDSEGEFWIGNDVMNLMTTEEENVLRVHLASFDGDDIDLDYSSFIVGNESTNYVIRIGPPTGQSARLTAANSLRYHNNKPFSTFDRKNDGFEQNCAATYRGGWWFNGCYFGFLTGEYFRPEDKRENWQGIMWYDWKGSASLKGASMMIRPKNFLK